MKKEKCNIKAKKATARSLVWNVEPHTVCQPTIILLKLFLLFLGDIFSFYKRKVWPTFFKKWVLFRVLTAFYWQQFCQKQDWWKNIIKHWLYFIKPNSYFSSSTWAQVFNMVSLPINLAQRCLFFYCGSVSWNRARQKLWPYHWT